LPHKSQGLADAPLLAGGFAVIHVKGLGELEVREEECVDGQRVVFGGCCCWYGKGAAVSLPFGDQGGVLFVALWGLPRAEIVVLAVDGNDGETPWLCGGGNRAGKACEV